MGKINPLRFIEDYADLFRFVDAMLAVQDAPRSVRQHEADTALLASAVGFVFDVHELFAGNICDDQPESCFETVGTLLDLEHDLPAYDLMIKQLREGVMYSMSQHRWVRDPKLTPKPNCLSVVEWNRFMRFRVEEQWESYHRCRSLLAHLCGDGRERFCALLVSDLVDREIERMGLRV